VSLAHFLNLGLLRAGKVTEVVVEHLRLAGGEGLPDERAYVLVVADGGGQEKLVQFICGLVAVCRNNFPARWFGGKHHRGCARGRRRKFRDSEFVRTRQKSRRKSLVLGIL